jgi:hypothetical protein
MKMKVEIKRISVSSEGIVRLLLQCCEPPQKEIPFSNGREELDRNNKLFEENTKSHRIETKEFRKETLKLHLGVAQLLQEEADR